MKIIFFASDNNQTSGAFLSMVKLCTILKEKYKHEIIVILPCDGNGTELLKIAEIEYQIIKSYHWCVRERTNRIRTNIHMVLNTIINYTAEMDIRRLYRKEQPDIVHINTTYTYVGAKIAKKYNIPYVWHLREFLEEDQNVKIWNKKYGHKLIGQANRIVAISKSIYRKYSSIFSKDKLTIVLNGIDEKRFAHYNHALFQNKLHELLIVGTICESKGQIQAIEACKMLRDEGVDSFILKIVGRGDVGYINELKTYVVEHKMERNVEFCGPQSSVEAFYKNADITLICSEAEAFGRTTVEAMMAGTLVIGSDNAGTSELVKNNETGLLYEKGNVVDLKNKIQYALEHLEMMKIVAKKGQSFMLENMTADINAANVNKLYNEIIDSK